MLELLNQQTVVQDFTDVPLSLTTFVGCATCGSNDERLTVSKFSAGITDPHSHLGLANSWTRA